jgi:hypothetical protein
MRVPGGLGSTHRGRGVRIAGLGNGVEAPAQRAALQVVGGDVTPHTAATGIPAAVADHEVAPCEKGSPRAGVGRTLRRGDFPALGAGSRIQREGSAIERRHVQGAAMEHHPPVGDIHVGVACHLTVAMGVESPE